MSASKWCFVPICTSTSKRNPGKIFVSVPKNLARKEKWFAAANRNLKEVSPKSTLYCCQDHFNLKDDMANYYEYHLSKVSARMKPGVVPHIFICNSDKELQLNEEKQNSGTSRKRKISPKSEIHGINLASTCNSFDESASSAAPGQEIPPFTEIQLETPCKTEIKEESIDLDGPLVLSAPSVSFENTNLEDFESEKFPTENIPNQNNDEDNMRFNRRTGTPILLEFVDTGTTDTDIEDVKPDVSCLNEEMRNAERLQEDVKERTIRLMQEKIIELQRKVDFYETVERLKMIELQSKVDFYETLEGFEFFCDKFLTASTSGYVKALAKRKLNLQKNLITLS